MTKKLVSFDDQAVGSGLPAAVKAELSSTYGFKGVQQVAPTLHAYEMKAQVQRRALVLTSTGTVYTVNNVSRLVQKSSDFGTTWTNQGTMPFEVHVTARSHVTGTLIATEYAGGYANPCRIARSTDDGQTWTILPFTFNNGPLEEQGVICTTSGHWLVGEYGNMPTQHSYRIMRSTDDGQTFVATYASSGTDNVGDPGHIHSITYDHVEDCYVAFSDRPAWPRPQGTSGPYLLRSDDEGATWQIIGEAKNEWDPNFVAPMYFDNYIAWGYDNHRNGVISRIARADFYAGNWTRQTVEDVAQLNDKVFYSTFPMRDGVWAISQAVEKITDDAVKDPGSFAQEVHLVSQDGAVVSGGFQFMGPTHPMVTPASTRVRFPSYDLGAVEHGRFAWINVNLGYPYNRGAVPLTVGIGPTLPKLDSAPLVPPVMVPGSSVKGRVEDGSTKALIDFDAYEQLVVQNRAATVANPVKAVLTKAGNWEFYSGATLLLAFSATVGLTLRSGQTRLGSGSGPIVFAQSGDPNGVLAAPKASLCFDALGPDYGPLWLKVANGGGTAGWAQVAVFSSGATSGRPPGRPVGTQYFDTTLGKPVWWNGTAWVDATGTAA